LEPLHNLLKRQLKRHFGDIQTTPEEWQAFLDMVNSAYWEFDADRNMLERALELSSNELLEANSEMRAVLQAFPDVIIRFNPEGIIIDFKAGSSTDLYVSPEKVIGKYIQDIYANSIGVSFAETIPQVLASGLIVNMEYSYRQGEQMIFYEVRFLPLLKDQVIAIIRNITERKLMEEKLRFLSMHDALTGLYNRAFFMEEITKLDSETFQAIGLILCDIDGLKLVNDTLGHEAGDRLLVETTRLLCICLSGSGVVSRIGGDEFAILIYETDRYCVEAICSAIREAINRHNQYNYGLPLSISLGFAMKNFEFQRMEDIFKEADDNMYREKLHHRQSGRSNMVQTLMQALGERDFITQGHAQRLQGLVNLMAVSLDLPKHQMADLNLLAQFHDIGKVGIADQILFKNGPLDERERVEMARHSEIGYRIAKSSRDLIPISEWILHHHEAWNGQGYPMGLRAEEIPLECRILALADAYDAMTNDRPYRKAMSQAEAIIELRRSAGSQFDPVLAERFIETILFLPYQKV